MKITRTMFFKWKPEKYLFYYKTYFTWLWWEFEFNRKVTLTNK